MQDKTPQPLLFAPADYPGRLQSFAPAGTDQEQGKRVRRLTLRLDEEDQAIIAQLLKTWKKDGRCVNDTDVIREALRQAENHRRRSSKQPQLPRRPERTGGESTRGRPKKLKTEHHRHYDPRSSTACPEIDDERSDESRHHQTFDK